nr:hypothetical protein [Ancylobacter sp. Lp-2]
MEAAVHRGLGQGDGARAAALRASTSADTPATSPPVVIGMCAGLAMWIGTSRALSGIVGLDAVGTGIGAAEGAGGADIILLGGHHACAGFGDAERHPYAGRSSTDDQHVCLEADL